MISVKELEFEKKLIQNIKEHPCLYDKDDANFQDVKYKNEKWKIVGENCKKDTTECKRKFLHLMRLFKPVFEDVLNEKITPEMAQNIFPHYNSMSYAKAFMYSQDPQDESETSNSTTSSLPETPVSRPPVFYSISLFDKNSPVFSTAPDPPIFPSGNRSRTVFSFAINTTQTPVTLSPAPATPSPAPATLSPAPANPSPTSTTPNPAPATPSPGPATPNPVPATPNSAPTAPSPAPATRSAAPATSSPVPANPSPAPSTPSPAPTTPSPAPVTHSAAPATPSPAPATHSAAPATSSPASATPSPAPTTPSLAPATHSAAPATLSSVPATPIPAPATSSSASVIFSPFPTIPSSQNNSNISSPPFFKSVEARPAPSILCAPPTPQRPPVPPANDPDKSHIDFFFKGVCEQVKRADLSNTEFLEFQTTVLNILASRMPVSQ